MYKILVDNILMCDSRIEELALINPVVTLEENKAGSFSFKIPPNHPQYDLIQRRKSVVQVFQDDESEPLFSGMCIEISNDFYKQKQIYCEGELSYFNDSIQRQARYQNVTVRGLLENLVARHNEQVEEAKRFTVGIVTAADVNDSLYCYTNMESTMKCLKEDLADDLGGFFRVRHADGVKYLDYLAGSQNTNSQIIKLGKNLLDFSSNIDSSEIATAIIPQGAKLEEEAEVEGLEKRLTIESVNGGKDFIYSQEAVDAFGWIYTVVTWDDVTTAAALKSKAEKYLSEIQFENMVIEAKAVDLHLDNKAIERFKLSDEIRVVSKPHGLDKYFRLTKMTINLNNPESNTITLGKEENVGLSAKTNQENSEIKSAIENFSANAILNSAIANATQLIKQSMNGYITTVTNDAGVPTELLIMDTPDKATATKVWRWNINGLGYSNEGYNGKYALAMTMDGAIVADFITAGTMKADRIKGGVLSLGGKNNVNGVLNILDANGNIVGKWDSNGITLPLGTQLAWSQITGTDDIANKNDIPTNISQLNNDSNFATEGQIPTSTSQLKNDSGYATADDIPKNTSDLNNDSYFATVNQIPTDNSQLKNGAGYATEEQIPKNNNQLENGAGYTTMTDVEKKGYQNASQVTQITKDTVTTEFINALKVKAGSVDAENISGNIISGKVIDGCVIQQSGYEDGENTWLEIATADMRGGYIGCTNSLDFSNEVNGECSLAVVGQNSIQLRSPELYVGQSLNIYRGYTGTLQYVSRIEDNGDGTITWYTGNLIVKNGILI